MSVPTDSVNVIRKNKLMIKGVDLDILLRRFLSCDAVDGANLQG